MIDDTSNTQDGSLTRWAWLSVAAALITVVLKFGAYGLTDSVGLLSDAIESTVNVVAALTALFALWFSRRPADRTHHYGHEKIEYFASSVEGGLVLIAALGITWYSVQRLIEPQPLQRVGIGLAVSGLAAIINLAVARTLLGVARRSESVVLRSEGKHLMTDVWTTLGVVVAVGLVQLTGIERLDPIISIVVALFVFRTGILLLKSSFDGLMDRSLEPEDEAAIRRIITESLTSGTTYHALRTRRAGPTRFVDLHLLVPGSTSVDQAHELANRIELAIEAVRPGTETTVHIEPLEDPDAWRDSEVLQFEPTLSEIERELEPDA